MLLGAFRPHSCLRLVFGTAIRFCPAFTTTLNVRHEVKSPNVGMLVIPGTGFLRHMTA